MMKVASGYTDPHAAYGSSLGAMLQFGQDDAGEHEHEPPAPLQHAQPMCAHICEHDRVQSHGSGGFGVVVFGGSGGAGPLATIAKTGMVAMPQIPVGPTPRFISMNPLTANQRTRHHTLACVRRGAPNSVLDANLLRSAPLAPPHPFLIPFHHTKIHTLLLSAGSDNGKCNERSETNAAFSFSSFFSFLLFLIVFFWRTLLAP